VKTLGLIGGTGWVSTLEYYRLLNEGVARRLGGHEAARCIVYSFNFGDLPIFDTLAVHAKAAVDFLLA
jgi:aspartate racemase